MPKSEMQGLKILYILKFLEENSDEQHPVTTSQIITHLANLGIKAERKSVYADIERLCLFGADIVSERMRGYYIASRSFEPAELKLLVDCIQSNRFMTSKKSQQLIGKLESLLSRHQAQDLQRQVYIANRVKSGNEQIYYNIDTLHQAINQKKQIAFHYTTYTTDKQKVLKRDKEYIVHPYALMISEEHYYLVCYYGAREKISNFRVDRMEKIRILDENVFPIEQTGGKDFDLGEYSKRQFNMYTGEKKTITLLCENEMMNAVIDRFGENIFAVPYDDKHFTVKADVLLSPTFYSWVVIFGGRIKILEPEQAVKDFKKLLEQF